MARSSPPPRKSCTMRRSGSSRKDDPMTHKPGAVIKVNDRMQRGYSYELAAPAGKKFAKDFDPYFTPRQMLELGIFEGKYCNDCRKEFPENWFEKARTSDI